MTDDHQWNGRRRRTALTWRALNAGDLPLPAEWLRKPEVARWWNHDTTPAGVQRDFGPSTRGEERGEDLVVLLDGQPIGLLQRSVIRDYPEDLAEFEAIVEVPDGAVELDYLIGAAAHRGRGLGSRLIAPAVTDTWTTWPDACAVLVAVVATNVTSWRALEKAGLSRIAEGPMSPDNPIDDPLHYVYRVDRPWRRPSRPSGPGRTPAERSATGQPLQGFRRSRSGRHVGPMPRRVT